MNADLAQYVQEKGWKTTLVEGGRQLRIDDDCPFCGKPAHLMFSTATTKWDCKRCGETGNLLTMKRQLGDITLEVRSAVDIMYRGAKDHGPRLSGERPPDGTDLRLHQRLVGGECPEALDYLLARGFTEETIVRFKLGVAGKGSGLFIAIPAHHRGELVGFKFRSVPPAKKAFSRWKDCPSVLFNGDCLLKLKDRPADERRVLVCEAETDAMALVQMGFELVVSSTTGAGKVDWPAHWLMPLEPATTIYLLYDADEAGEDGAMKAANALGPYRCRRVVLPMNDAAKLLEAGYDRSVIDEAIEASASYEESAVRPASAHADDLRSMLSNPKPRGRPSGWITLDAILGGIRDAEMTVVTGDTGSGKSTFSVALCRNQLLQGVPVLVAPFEQPCHEVLGKLVGMQAKKSIYKLGQVELEHAIDETLALPVYFLDKAGPTPFGEIKDAIHLAVRRYGVKVVLLDHLHFFLDCAPESERTAIDAVVRALEVLVKDTGVHIVLVCHPSKLGKDQDGNVRKVTLDDLKGSSEIKKTADNGILVYRERANAYGSTSDEVELGVLKCRSPAGGEGATRLYFDPDGERYLESSQPAGTGQASGAGGCRNGDPDDEYWGGWSEPH